jgi:type IV pilus assembly protein PilC
MPAYTYVVKNQEGKTLKGTVEASDTDSAREVLREKQYVVVSITEKRESGFRALLERLRGVSLSEKALFARQLSSMVSAGVPLPGAMEILRDQLENPKMKEALGGMLRDIQGGTSLSKSLAKYPEIFSRDFVAMVEAGEASGKLESILASLADKMEKERVFQGKTKGAFIYPAVIISALIVVFIIVVTFVVPRLATMYEDVGADLPLPTQVLIAIANIMRKGWWAILLLLGVGIYLLRRFAITDYGRHKIAEITFNFPVFGKLSKDTQLAAFCRTLSLLVATGVPITQSLEIVAGAVGNILYHDAILKASKQVEKGIPLSDPLKADPNFPPILSQMVKVGEETGKLDSVLGKLTAFFEAEAEQTVRNISSAIEPIIIIVLGLVIGLFVVSVITPIYQLTSQI